MFKRLAAVAFLVGLSAPALAQQVPPYVYPIALGTSSVTVLAADAARKKLIFHNPNDVAKVAVCPVGPSRAPGGSQSQIVAVINGAGCITILPYDSKEISGGTPSGPQQAMPSAWVGIASAGSSALTIFEFE